MKKLLVPALLSLSLLVSGCMSAAMEDSTAIPDGTKILTSDVQGSNYHIFGQYSRNSDGTWTCGDYTYQYLVELWGMDGIPAKVIGYVVLTNDLEITFTEVKKSMYSSSTYDWIPAARAKLVGFIY